jgi:hypothetical protein
LAILIERVEIKPAIEFMDDRHALDSAKDPRGKAQAYLRLLLSMRQALASAFPDEAESKAPPDLAHLGCLISSRLIDDDDSATSAEFSFALLCRLSKPPPPNLKTGHQASFAADLVVSQDEKDMRDIARFLLWQLEIAAGDQIGAVGMTAERTPSWLHAYALFAQANAQLETVDEFSNVTPPIIDALHEYPQSPVLQTMQRKLESKIKSAAICELTMRKNDESIAAADASSSEEAPAIYLEAAIQAQRMGWYEHSLDICRRLISKYPKCREIPAALQLGVHILRETGENGDSERLSKWVDKLRSVYPSTTSPAVEEETRQ